MTYMEKTGPSSYSFSILKFCTLVLQTYHWNSQLRMLKYFRRMRAFRILFLTPLSSMFHFNTNIWIYKFMLSFRRMNWSKYWHYLQSWMPKFSGFMPWSKRATECTQRKRPRTHHGRVACRAPGSEGVLCRDGASWAWPGPTCPQEPAGQGAKEQARRHLLRDSLQSTKWATPLEVKRILRIQTLMKYKTWA